MATIATIQHLEVIGYGSGVNGSPCLIDDTTLVWPAGSAIVAKTIDKNNTNSHQRFLLYNEQGVPAPCMCVSGDKSILCIADKGTSAVHVYDAKIFKKRRTIQMSSDKLNITELMHLQVSSDTKWIAAISKDPDVYLIYSTLDKGKMMACERLKKPEELCELLINPFDASQLCVLYKQAVVLKRYAEGAFQAKVLKINDEISCFCWVNERHAVVCTKNGTVYPINDKELSQSIKLPTTGQITCCSSREGSVLVGDSNGKLFVLERDSDIFHPTHIIYSLKKQKSLVEEMAITSIVISPSETTVLLFTEKATTFQYVAESDQGDLIQPILYPYHHGSVLGMDICPTKPIVATCGSDNSIKVFNYLTSQLLVSKFFPEEASCISLHPSGFFIAIGFVDKLRIMSIYVDDIKFFGEFSLRSCRDAKFSNGGHLIAAGHGNTITIISVWTCEIIASLKGHSGKIKSISWSKNDAYIVSSSHDGAVYTWNMRTFKREQDYIQKSCRFVGAVCSQEGSTVYAIGSDSSLKVIRESALIFDLPQQASLTSIQMSHDETMLFLGTGQGTIRSIKFPVTQINKDDIIKWQEFPAHSGPVNQIRFSHDNQYIFSCSQDGTVFMYKVSDATERSGMLLDMMESDEILITKDDLEEKTAVINDLMRQMEEVRMEHEYQLRLKDMSYADNLKVVIDEYTLKIDSLKMAATDLRMEKEREDLRFNGEMRNTKTTNLNSYQASELKYTQQLMDEYEKNEKLQEEYSQLQKQWQQKIEQVNKETKNAIASTQQDYEKKLKLRGAEVRKLKESLETQSKEYNEVLNQTEQDADTEIDNLKQKYEQKLQLERDDYAKLKGENGIMNKKFNTLNKEIEDYKVDIANYKENGLKLSFIVEKLESNKLELKKEMALREQVIQDRERKVYELKKRNQELEKFKFVLDHRIKELKQQIEPKEKQIGEMTDAIKYISDKLESSNISNRSLEEEIENLEGQVTDSRKQYSKHHNRVRETDRYLDGLKKDTEDLVQYIQDPATLKKSVQRMFKKYCVAEQDEHDTLADQQLLREAEEHDKFLYKASKQIYKDLEKNKAQFKNDSQKTIEQNTLLLREISKLKMQLVPQAATKAEDSIKVDTAAFLPHLSHH